MLDDTATGAFWAKVDRRGPDECWPWLGSLTAKGYGLFHYRGKRRPATQLMLVLDGRERPSPRYFALHKCDNPPCMNPAHLWWGTHSDNIRDAVEKGRHQWARRTHCKQGHPYSGHNLIIGKRGRVCRACRTAAQNRLAAEYQAGRKKVRTVERLAALEEAARVAEMPFPAFDQAVSSDRSLARKIAAAIRALKSSVAVGPDNG